MPSLLLAALALLATAILPADRGPRADEPCQFLQNMPSEEELIDCLAGPPRVRGLQRVETSAAPAPPPQASLMVTFEFDSADLTAEARTVLDTLGRALQASPLRASRFVIEGHTDAVGSEAYNQGLSERRAEAVARYLEGRYTIGSDRMRTVGKGPHELLDPSQPEAAINRRVKIINLGEG